MSDDSGTAGRLLRDLNERAKELSCLYRVDEALRLDAPLPERLRLVAEALPAGWQHPSVCAARIVVGGHDVRTEGFAETAWAQKAPIVVQGETAGEVQVCYTNAMPEADEGPFLKEERKLIDTIAGRLGQVLLHRDLTELFGPARPGDVPAWRIIVDLLRRTDRALYRQIARRLLNNLSCLGIDEAKALLPTTDGPSGLQGDDNRPLESAGREAMEAVPVRAFHLAAERLSERELLSFIQVWVKEDRVNFLVKTLESSHSSLTDIAAALERYRHTGVSAHDLSPATQTGLKVSLIRRLLSDDQGYINACRPYVEIEDFFELLERTVLLPDSHGRLGGKAAGLFLATRVLARAPQAEPLRGVFLVPRTWYLPSDGIVRFVSHNDLDDVYSWKYRDLEQIRREYPHLVQLFKSSPFPHEMTQGLSTVLDDLGERPLIVRSSSLLEDRAGSAFSGKYKSLFLANEGPKAARLAALQDAIAEVYASVFGPDPIQYRIERGLLERHEEMGVLIQEVVGSRMGRYFLPVVAGVGLSNNELRWSPRIRRDDGLLRLVPGLGTRAVDRLSDDYPVLVAPGQPGLRVNVTADEIRRYSPHRIDVIDLDAAGFATVDAAAFLQDVGAEIAGLADLVSVLDHDHVRRPAVLDPRVDGDQAVFTFQGLLERTPFVARMGALLRVLREATGTPVEVEFASDGRHLHLVQCRAQTYAPSSVPSPIPRDLPAERIVFTAHRHVSNGVVPDLTHVVYVDPDAYARLGHGSLHEVGRAVGLLNKRLPRRRFALMGPGRWGSRGDVRLGVSVTYADINNTALLVEIARRRGNYVPDLSFGTHFFQDLVEAQIRYLPLYPDEPGVTFREPFFRGGDNLLPAVVPELAALADVVHVVDVPARAGGLVLRVLMNADLDEAVGALVAADPPTR